MPVLQCTNGHVTIDRDARACPQCGARIVMRRGWRQDEELQTSYAPFSPMATVALGTMMGAAGMIGIATGIALTMAVGMVLVVIGVALVARGMMRRRV